MVDLGGSSSVLKVRTRLWLASHALGEQAAACFVPKPCEACFVLWVMLAGCTSYLADSAPESQTLNVLTQDRESRVNSHIEISQGL